MAVPPYLAHNSYKEPIALLLVINYTMDVPAPVRGQGPSMLAPVYMENEKSISASLSCPEAFSVVWILSVWAPQRFPLKTSLLWLSARGKNFTLKMLNLKIKNRNEKENEHDILSWHVRPKKWQSKTAEKIKKDQINVTVAELGYISPGF